MKIELTAREWFALNHSEIGQKARRKLFGTMELRKKIWEQFIREIPVEEIKAIEKEWEALEIPQMPPKPKKVFPKNNFKSKPYRVDPYRGSTRTWHS